MKEIIVATLLAVGVVASLSGAVGILRMPDVYLRIQAAAKTVTMGALPVLVAVVVAKGPITNYGGRALLVAVLLVITSPLASHALARAAYRSGIPMWRGAVLDQAAARRHPVGAAGGAHGDDQGGAHGDDQGGANGDDPGGAHGDDPGGAHGDDPGGAHGDDPGGAHHGTADAQPRGDDGVNGREA